MTRTIDKNIQKDVDVLDFAKAFDKVNHSLLVHKLRNYWIAGKTNTWIKDFLKDRLHESVVVDGHS